MKTPILFDNVPYAYANKLLDDVSGKPDFGNTRNANKVVDVSAVPAEYQEIVKTAAEGAKTITVGQLETALNAGVDAIVSSDKTFGVHTSPWSFWRRFNIGGNGIIEKQEQVAAAKKSPLAFQILKLIEDDKLR